MNLVNVEKVNKYYGTGNTRIGLKDALLHTGSASSDSCFTALSESSFTISKGEAFGIIGRNGSGKSTLLQIIAGTLKQDSGTVHVSGRISALLELGSGFNPDFTGIENIYLSGSILGIAHQVMQNKVHQIEEFADIGSFIHEPVRTYSSGMLMRVAFAVAIAVEPDLLIIDEALSVGDILFQQKCNQRLKELLAKGVSLLVVTHDTSFVLNICQRALWLHKGKQMYLGNASECVQRYLAAMANEAGNQNVDQKLVTKTTQISKLPSGSSFDLSKTKYLGDIDISINKFWVTNDSCESASAFRLGDWCRITLGVVSRLALKQISAGCELRDRHGQVVFATGLRVVRKLIPSIDPGEEHFIEIRFQLNLAPSQYTLDVGCGSGLREDVKGSRYVAATIIEILSLPEDEIVHGLVRLPHTVEILKL